MRVPFANQGNVFLKPSYPLIVGERLRETSLGSYVRPGQRAVRVSQCLADAVTESLVGRERPSLAGPVPVGALALRTETRLLLDVSGNPLVAASLTPESHDGDGHTCHVYLPNHIADKSYDFRSRQRNARNYIIRESYDSPIT